MELTVFYELLKSAGLTGNDLLKSTGLGNDLGNKMVEWSAAQIINNMPIPAIFDILYEKIAELPVSDMPLLISETAWFIAHNPDNILSKAVLLEVLRDVEPNNFMVVPEENPRSYDTVLQRVLIDASNNYVKDGNITEAIECQEKLIELLGHYEPTTEIKRQTAYAYGHLAELHNTSGDFENEKKSIYSELALFGEYMNALDTDDFQERARISYDSAQAVMALGARLPYKKRNGKKTNKIYSSKKKCFINALKRLDRAGSYQNKVNPKSPEHDKYMLPNILRKKIKCYGELSKIREHNGDFGEKTQYCEEIIALYGKLTEFVSLDRLDNHDSAVIKTYEKARSVLNKFQNIEYGNTGVPNTRYV